MTVYVDDMRAPFGRMVMCHMLADTEAELLEMARRIGVDVKWLQSAGTYRAHFDVCLSKREKAIRLGAVPIDRRGVARLLRGKRASGG